jgi:hypothetical protein
MSQEMQNIALLKSALKKFSVYWQNFWKYRIGEFSIEGWAWIGILMGFFLWIGFGILSYIDSYEPRPAAQERSQTEILEDILEELKND